MTLIHEVLFINVYSNGHSLQQTPHCTGQNVAVRVDLCNILQLSEMRTPHYFIKWTDFVVPLAGLYKIHFIMQTLAGLTHNIVRHR